MAVIPLLLGLVAAVPGCSEEEESETPAQSGGSAGAAGGGQAGSGGGQAGSGGGQAGSGGGQNAAGAATDVGKACDPNLEETTCQHGCLPKDDGTGICVGLCGPSGATVCPEGYKCNNLPFDDGSIDLCLPNASCGDLTFKGKCEGTTLTYCDLTGPVSFDCATEKDPQGEPLKCGLVSEELGNDCVSQQFTGGCGQETTGGRCDGNTRVYCESAETGKVLKEDCGARQCAVAGGIASCNEQGKPGCGTVNEQGTCDGNTVVKCAGSELSKTDCAATQQACGLLPDGSGYGCVAPPTTTGQMRAKGVFQYEKRALTQQGLGDATPVPVRKAVVKVLRKSDNGEIVRGLTGDDGSYDLAFEASEEVFVAVISAGDPAAHPLTVRDCPAGGCSGGGNVYAIATDPFTPSADSQLGTKIATVASDVAGAFNIYDIFVKGIDFAAKNYGKLPPAITTQWKAGSDTSCQTSCFSPAESTIYIQGKNDDRDEYDDPVLMHEWGHFMESAFSRSDSPGGAHDGSPTDPRLAWGEGYGTFVGCVIAGSSVYIDTSAAGASVTDISNTGVKADPSAIQGISQAISEFTTAEILWKIASGNGTLAGKGTEPIFDVLGKYFPTSALADRGVNGVDLVDFLDGWFCRGHGSKDLLDAVVVKDAKFPYDYKGKESCK